MKYFFLKWCQQHEVIIFALFYLKYIMQVHHFIPLEPWSCKKIKGKRRQMKIDGSNDGPSSKFEKKEQIKLVLDMSNDGPMFKAIVNFFTLYSKQTYSFLITC